MRAVLKLVTHQQHLRATHQAVHHLQLTLQAYHQLDMLQVASKNLKQSHSSQELLKHPLEITCHHDEDKFGCSKLYSELIT